jgi:hypothetical protein
MALENLADDNTPNDPTFNQTLKTNNTNLMNNSSAPDQRSLASNPLTPEQQNIVNIINKALTSGRGGCCGIPDPLTAFNQMAKDNAKFINPNLLGDVSALAFEGAGSDVHSYGRSVGHTWNVKAINNAISNIFNPTLTSEEQKVFSDTANKATQALNTKQAPQMQKVDQSKFKLASSSALGGNVKTPQMFQSAIAKMNENNQKALDLFGQQVSMGRNLISQLNDPMTQQEFALKYMNGLLGNVVQYIGKLGTNPQDILTSLSNMYKANDQYNNLMNQYFATMLGLQYNLPADINKEFDKQNAIAQQMLGNIVGGNNGFFK